jgi:hypothetical protein
MSLHKKYRGICIIYIVIMIGSTGCQLPTATNPPRRDPASITEAEAIAVLKQAEVYAKAGDVQALCTMGDFSQTQCEQSIRNLGGLASVPRVSPMVIRQHIIPARPHTSGGRLLIVEGPNNSGSTYQTSILIYENGEGTLVPLEPVYWSGMGFAMSTSAGAASTSPGPLPPPISTTPISITP